MRPLLYQTIAERIVQDCIERGGLRPGDRLPSITQLQRQFSVSRNTVWQALSMLGQKGVLENRQGSGCYVADPWHTRGVGRQNLIGFLASHIHCEIMTNLFSGIERTAQRYGMHVMVMNSEREYDRERLHVHEAVQAGCVAIIMAPVMRTIAQLAHDYLNTELLDFPIVLVDMADPSHKRTKVVFNNYQSGLEMTELLIRKGHRRIATMHFAHARGAYVSRSLDDRYAGYREAMRQAGLQVYKEDHWPVRFYMGDHLDECTALLRQWCNQSPRPTAIIATEDYIAVSMSIAARRMGIVVPDDLLIVGFDNLPIARSFDPPFPTSNPDFHAMGVQAVHLVLQRASGRLDPDVTCILPAPIIERTRVSTSQEYLDTRTQGVIQPIVESVTHST